jgi:hypothetical protein
MQGPVRVRMADELDSFRLVEFFEAKQVEDPDGVVFH